MAEKTFCNQCGRETTPGTTFCVQCGARIGSSGAGPVAGAAAAPAMAPNAAYGGAAAYPSRPAPVRYAGFWIRFVAALIDGILVECVVIPISIVIGGAIGVASSVSRNSGAALGGQLLAGMLTFAIGAGGAWIYEAAMESSSKQATLGKMIFGMKVTDLNGNRISFGRATGRHFAKYISGLTLLIGYIIAGFTEKKQALHDMIVGTLVRR
jgi:uncharacterized RDD family membrane protein YckC